MSDPSPAATSGPPGRPPHGGRGARDAGYAAVPVALGVCIALVSLTVALVVAIVELVAATH